MSIHFDASRDRFVVRWKDDGRRRVRRFLSEADAIAFDASLLRPMRRAPLDASVPTPAAGDGIYAYETREGTRYSSRTYVRMSIKADAEALPVHTDGPAR
jgi:hypothetical protein